MAFQALDFSAAELQQLADNVPLQRVHWSAFDAADLEVFVRRDDLLDPLVSGNKFYKLFHNVAAAQASGLKQILSFGGAWSNHIHALAALGKKCGIKTIGVIRGERPPELSAMLLDAESMGMSLHFVSRQAYRDKESLLPDIDAEYGEFYVVPEGGGNSLGALGCKAIGLALSKRDVDTVFLPAATGGTVAGVAGGLADGQQVMAVNVLKGQGDLEQDIAQMTQELGNHRSNWQLLDTYHCGGYAKFPNYLSEFVCEFERRCGFAVDPIYGAKLWWALNDLAQRKALPAGSKIAVVHTGGLQGRRGFDVLNNADNKRCLEAVND